LRTHESVVGATVEKLAVIDGKATNRIVVSRKTANMARLVEARTVHWLRGGRGAVTPSVGTVIEVLGSATASSVDEWCADVFP
jgi:hypothetical protein